MPGKGKKGKDKGKGKGKAKGKDKDKGVDQGKGTPAVKEEEATTEKRCFHCGEAGHVWAECWWRLAGEEAWKAAEDATPVAAAPWAAPWAHDAAAWAAPADYFQAMPLAVPVAEAPEDAVVNPRGFIF